MAQIAIVKLRDLASYWPLPHLSMQWSTMAITRAWNDEF